MIPRCDSSKCSSLGDDCCAPGTQARTCRGDLLAVDLAVDSWAQCGAHDALYTCCPVPAPAPPVPPPLPPPPPAPPCSGTVAYAFITRSTLPLWSSIDRYFSTCPAGSALPLVHTQDTSSSGRAALESQIAPYGGRLLPAEQTVAGYTRFSFKMNAIMLRLYGLANRTLAPNGCAPAYVHVLSERDVPVRSCADVHAFLVSTSGESHLMRSDTPIWTSPFNGRRPTSQADVAAAFRPFVRTSQWMSARAPSLHRSLLSAPAGFQLLQMPLPSTALWMPHAAALAAAEEELRTKWTPQQGRYDVWVPGSDGGRYSIWGAPDCF